MKFFTNSLKIHNFYKDVSSFVEKTFNRDDLVHIAEDFGVSKLTGTKKQIFGRVKKIMKKKGANYLNEKLREDNDALDRIRAKIAAETPPKLKPYAEMDVEELREEAISEQLLSTGNRNDIIERLTNLDNGVGQYEESSTEWITSQLNEINAVSTGRRNILIARLYDVEAGKADKTAIIKGKYTAYLNHWITKRELLASGGEKEKVRRLTAYNSGTAILGDFSDAFLKNQVETLQLQLEGGRRAWLLQLYPLEIADLTRKLRVCTEGLKAKPRTTVSRYRSKSHKKKSSEGSLFGTVVQGMALGAGIGLAGRILRRRLQQQTTLKF